MQLDSKALAEATATIVREFVGQATAPLLLRLEAMERQLAERPAAQNGRDGVDADPTVAAAEAVKLLEPVIAEQFGALSIDDEAIRAAVARYLEANPPSPGKDGRDGINGNDGAKGQDGNDGKDGVGLAGALIDRAGALVVTLTDGTTRDLGPVVGKDGDKGDAGLDGLGFEDLALERPDDRTLALKFTRGDITKTFEISLEHPIYRGVFGEGATYARGDTVTWAGSLWHCEDPTAEKPGEGAKSWTLAAKRGRDGRDGQAA